MGQSHSTGKKTPRVSQYCKNKHGNKAYYDKNACRKNGKVISKVTLKQFQELSTESHDIKNRSDKNKEKTITRQRKNNNKTKKKQ
jgi:hypothetical protein